MSFKQFDRHQLHIKKLKHRFSKLSVQTDMVSLTQKPEKLSEDARANVKATTERILSARRKQRSVMLAFGAHTIKNGMAPVLNELIEKGWLTHLATNGAGIIHDWEFAFLGRSSEDVRENVRLGQFGIWEETGYYINLALIVGAYEGLGYGESVGKMIYQEGLQIPEISYLQYLASQNMEKDPSFAASALDLAGTIQKFKLMPGFMSIPHPYKEYSVQSTAYKMQVKFTGHPMFGHDIIYNHPMNQGAAIGRTALTDFLYFAESVNNLDYGIYISLGSAVMSPMIFEKSLSMAQNIKIQENSHIDNHFIMVVDLAKSEWDWKNKGEPPVEDPAYYLRYCKTFHRMGGEMHYLTANNRDFLLELYHNLLLNQDHLDI